MPDLTVVPCRVCRTPVVNGIKGVSLCKNCVEDIENISRKMKAHLLKNPAPATLDELAEIVNTKQNKVGLLLREKLINLHELAK